ncbi:MAG: hypothetical protein QNJ81_01615 [Acidimicrobiia bacterium]|nr:hypothetical protein [Acidimicrobiia bacterium]
MGHDNGFRRNDHDTTHGPTMMRQTAGKASKHFEDRMRKKREQSERLRRLMEARKADQ